MSSLLNILTGMIRRPFLKKKAEVDGQTVDIKLDGTGFSSGGDTFFAFDLTDGNFSGDSLNIGSQTFDVIEKDGIKMASCMSKASGPDHDSH